MSQLDVLVVADLRRAFDARSFEPRALMFCLLADFWLSQLVLGPIIILTYRGAWMVMAAFLCYFQSTGNGQASHQG